MTVTLSPLFKDIFFDRNIVTNQAAVDLVFLIFLLGDIFNFSQASLFYLSAIDILVFFGQGLIGSKHSTNQGSTMAWVLWVCVLVVHTIFFTRLRCSINVLLHLGEEMNHLVFMYI